MRIVKFLYSLWFLGILFVIKIIKYFFRKEIDATKFLNKFKEDNIRMVNNETIILSIDASRCIGCGICSLNNTNNYLDGLVICYRISRDVTLFNKGQFNNGQLFCGDCPYEIEIRSISKILY